MLDIKYMGKMWVGVGRRRVDVGPLVDQYKDTELSK